MPILISLYNRRVYMYYRNVNHVQMTEFSSFASEFCGKKWFFKYAHKIPLRSIKGNKKLYKTSLRWKRT